jgi:hypothetical protein
MRSESGKTVDEPAVAMSPLKAAGSTSGRTPLGCGRSSVGAAVAEVGCGLGAAAAGAQAAKTSDDRIRSGSAIRQLVVMRQISLET